MSEAKQLADRISPNMNSKTKETFDEYRYRQNRIADSLEEMAVHLLNVAKHCNEVSDECGAVSKELIEFSGTTLPKANETSVN